MRIDAHQHYWRLSRGDYGWLNPEMPVLYRDYGPEQLRSHLEAAGIDQTIVVQATEAALFLASEESKFMMGSPLYIDGGVVFGKNA